MGLGSKHGKDKFVFLGGTRIYKGVLLEKVQSYKYLGILFAKNGRAMEHLADKSMKAMFSLQAT